MEPPGGRACGQEGGTDILKIFFLRLAVQIAFAKVRLTAQTYPPDWPSTPASGDSGWLGRAALHHWPPAADGG